MPSPSSRTEEEEEEEEEAEEEVASRDSSTDSVQHPCGPVPMLPYDVVS